MFFYDSTYLCFMIPGAILMMIAQLWVSSTFRRWSRIRNHYSISGVEAARKILTAEALYDVEIRGTRGAFTDNYNPRRKTLNLSQAVGEGQSVASLAITAHEIGHALQDQEGYLPLQIRSAMVPVVNIGSTFGWILLMIGLLLGGTLGTQLAWIGVGTFALGTLFAFATIPVELNASTRARALLNESGLITSAEEQRGVNAVLNAAAFTYVAALAASLMQLLYWISLIGGFGRRRR